MSRSAQIPSILLLGLLALTGYACGREVAEAPRRPNIILISLDTLRPDHLELYGYERETAPALAALASRSVVFANAFAQAPKTAPSHMTLFTGLYPSAHGVKNLDEADNVALSSEIPLMAELLEAAGYRTAGFTGGGHMGATLGFDRGFATFETGGAQFRRAADWLRALPADGNPCFVLVHTYSIHDPYLPDPRFQIFGDADYEGRIIGDPQAMAELVGEEWERQHEAFWERVDRDSNQDLRHLRDLYDAGILETDFQLNQLLGTLQELGMLEDALVIVLSDHGEEFQEHGGYLHESLYQENLRVPLLIKFPAGENPGLEGERIEPTVRLIDVLPSLLEYLGLPGQERLQGASFLPLLNSSQGARPREVLSEWPREGQRAIQLQGWKLIVKPEGDEVFHLEVDPQETENLATADAEPVERLRAALDHLVGQSEAILQVVTSGETRDLDPELREQLEALGYIN